MVLPLLASRHRNAFKFDCIDNAAGCQSGFMGNDPRSACAMGGHTRHYMLAWAGAAAAAAVAELQWHEVLNWRGAGHHILLQPAMHKRVRSATKPKHARPETCIACNPVCNWQTGGPCAFMLCKLLLAGCCLLYIAGLETA